jgi:hypothetical protein
LLAMQTPRSLVLLRGDGIAGKPAAARNQRALDVSQCCYQDCLDGVHAVFCLLKGNVHR